MKGDKRVLVACEQSQAVTKTLRQKGVVAFSADVLPCSGGRPDWHIRGDVRNVLYDGWGAVIAFPPCTHLASSGARWFPQKQMSGEQQRAVDFFMLFADLDCPRVAIENPVGILSTLWRKPDQIVHPWWFGHSASKRTCLWLKNLPPLSPTAIVAPNGWKSIPSPASANPGMDIIQRSGFWFEAPYPAPKPYWDNQTPNGNPKHSDKFYRSALRSKTFAGLALAMADQWSPLLI